MSEETQPVTFTEESVPVGDIEDGVEEMVDLYGGEVTARDPNARRFTLPLRRGISTSGGVECRLSWSDAGEVTMTCDREIDAPKWQRVLLLAVGVVGALLFTVWPFFPQRREFGALAWIGGAAKDEWGNRARFSPAIGAAATRSERVMCGGGHLRPPTRGVEPRGSARPGGRGRPPLQPIGEDCLRDRGELHVRRSLVDLSDLRVAPILLDRILFRVAVSAEKLHCQ